MSEPVFRGFDRHGEFDQYRRNLPHWCQPGATYFVTFRLADSIPHTVLEAWAAGRRDWLRAHAIDPALEKTQPALFRELMAKVPEPERKAFDKEQARQVHLEQDRCHGDCVLRRSEAARTVAGALRFFDGTRLWLGDFVVMPNHVHALMQPREDWKLEELLGSIKNLARDE